MNAQELQTAATAEIEAATSKLHSLLVTVDKSHIVTIGEKLYSQSDACRAPAFAGNSLNE